MRGTWIIMNWLPTNASNIIITLNIREIKSYSDIHVCFLSLIYVYFIKYAFKRYNRSAERIAKNPRDSWGANKAAVCARNLRARAQSSQSPQQCERRIFIFDRWATKVWKLYKLFILVARRDRQSNTWYRVTRCWQPYSGRTSWPQLCSCRIQRRTIPCMCTHTGYYINLI